MQQLHLLTLATRRACALAWVVAAGSTLAAEPVWDGNKVQMVREQIGPGISAYYPRDARELNAKGGRPPPAAG